MKLNIPGKQAYSHHFIFLFSIQVVLPSMITYSDKTFKQEQNDFKW